MGKHSISNDSKNNGNKKDRRITANTLIIIGAILIVIPGLLWAFATYSQWNDGKEWRKIADKNKLQSTSTTLKKDSLNSNTKARQDTQDKLSAEQIQLQAAKLVDRGLLKPGTSIAYISIPKLNLKLSVIEGESLTNLAKGPIRVSKTARIGDSGSTLISGHRTMYAAPFHNLHKLVVGDEIVIYTKKAIFSYTVKDIQRVKPTDWSYITKDGYPQVVLSTCDPMYSAAKRLLIIAKLRYANPIKNPN
jgi:sortase A